MAIDARVGQPRSEEAERSILGMLIRFGHIAKITKLQADDFYSERHRAIYSCMRQLSDENSVLDMVTLPERLRRSRLLELAGGEVYLMDLADSVVSSSGWEEWEKIIIQKSTLRAGIEIARRLNELAFMDDKAPDDIVAEFAGAVNDLAKRSATATVTPWKSAFGKVMIPKDQTAGMPTGIDFLDAILAIRPGQLGIIAGRPGDGKSSLATQILLGIARSSEGLLDSLEMDAEEVAQRMIAQMTGIPIDNIDSLHFSPEESAKVKACEDSLRLNFCSAPTVSELRAIAQVRKAHGDLRMIVVDYLQLLRVKRPSSSRVHDVTEISRDLKLLAMELQVPVIALSQFSRDAAKETPKLHHLRDSGSIEQDADWILFAYTDSSAQNGERKMIELAKNRRGPRQPPFAVTFNGQTVTFGNPVI